MEGKSSFSSFSGIRENLQQYIETRLLYYKLIMFEKMARAITTVISNLVVTLFVFMAFIFLSAALAFFLGTLLESFALGMLIVGGFYILLAIIIGSLKTKIFSPHVIKYMGKAFFENEDQEN